MPIAKTIEMKKNNSMFLLSKEEYHESFFITWTFNVLIRKVWALTSPEGGVMDFRPMSHNFPKKKSMVIEEENFVRNEAIQTESSMITWFERDGLRVARCLVTV